MPELAEVEFFRRQWNPGRGHRITAVEVHPRARVFRDTAAKTVAKALRGTVFAASEAAAKQMLFRFGEEVWLGIHLGMSGELSARPADHRQGKHDHLILRTAGHALVFTDPRMFGCIDLHRGAEPPPWWARLPPAILTDEFTAEAVRAFLQRRSRAPIKAVLLMQERFPGIGNWMADEILWRAALHPRRAAGSLSSAEIRTLWSECRRVARMALDTIAGRTEADTPPALNAHIPGRWLFNHRWEDGGKCPRTGCLLVREPIGGRTTCWSPARQVLR